jgi:hypothetical protein
MLLVVHAGRREGLFVLESIQHITKHTSGSFEDGRKQRVEKLLSYE